MRSVLSSHIEDSSKYPECNMTHVNSLKEVVRFLEIGRSSEAACICSAILDASPENIHALHYLGIAKAMDGNHTDAVACYEKSLYLSPNYPAAHNNLGKSLITLHRIEEAVKHLEKALVLRPDFPEAFNNLGNALRALKRHEESLHCYKKALQLRPGFPEAHNNIGHALDSLGKHEEAISHLEQALVLRPGFGNAITKLADLKSKTCDWSNFTGLQRELKLWAMSDKEPLGPFVLLAYTDDPEEQLHCAKRYAENAIRHPEHLPALHSRNLSNPVRVAYLSADFYNHATGYLIAEMIEKHDREKFEIHAFSIGVNKTDAMSHRLANAFDKFHDVSDKSDLEVAELIRHLGIHIAVDLKGYTAVARPSILAYRPAPVQVSYLGYPGTMGADHIDYIIVDQFVAPPDLQEFYSENFVYLPTCYQVNDSKREIAHEIPSRSACGLPDKGFVFCCLNNNYKITPSIFDVWMRLLNKTPGSVLWLLKDNKSAAANLCREAEKRGVESERLVFAPRIALSHHISRLRLADLFLDTFPCNAHTTASEALWAGLPVITYSGRSFASRVAGSLLNAVGLPELAMYSLKDYETMALNLAQSPQLLESCRRTLLRNREVSQLFKGETFTRYLEMAYLTMLQRWNEHRAPMPFSVSSSREDNHGL